MYNKISREKKPQLAMSSLIALLVKVSIIRMPNIASKNESNAVLGPDNEVYCKNCYSHEHGHKSKPNLHDSDVAQFQVRRSLNESKMKGSLFLFSHFNAFLNLLKQFSKIRHQLLSFRNCSWKSDIHICKIFCEIFYHFFTIFHVYFHY